MCHVGLVVNAIVCGRRNSKESQLKLLIVKRTLNAEKKTLPDIQIHQSSRLELDYLLICQLIHLERTLLYRDRICGLTLAFHVLRATTMIYKCSLRLITDDNEKGNCIFVHKNH